MIWFTDLDRTKKIFGNRINPKSKTGNVIVFWAVVRANDFLSFSDESNDHFCIIFYKKVLNINLTSLDVGLSPEDKHQRFTSFKVCELLSEKRKVCIRITAWFSQR